MKDFAYVSLENDSEVSIWMSSLYMTNILRVYGQIYMSDGDKFKETFEGVQSLKRRAIPYGPNEPLTSTTQETKMLLSGKKSPIRVFPDRRSPIWELPRLERHSDW